MANYGGSLVGGGYSFGGFFNNFSCLKDTCLQLALSLSRNYPGHGVSLSGPYPVLIQVLLGHYPVLILVFSCPCPVLILSLSCSYPVFTLSLSCPYPVLILSLSCPYLLRKMTKSQILLFLIRKTLSTSRL